MSLERSAEGFPLAALHEIKLLSKLNHENIVQFFDVAVAKYAPPEKLLDDPLTPTSAPFSYPWNFFMVCEYAEHSLSGLLNCGYRFSPPEVKCVLRQILSGLAFLHSQSIMHRDIKCSNILMNSTGQVKLADFGMSIRFRPGTLHKGQRGVVTLWYRAPELLMGAEYSESIDMWAVGCVLGELLKGNPLFRGKNEQEQLNKITAALGNKPCGSFTTPEDKGQVPMSLWEELRLSYA